MDQLKLKQSSWDLHPDGVVCLSDERISYTNPAFQELVRRDSAAINDASPNLILRPDNGMSVRAWRDLVRQGEQPERSWRCLLPNGNTRPVWVSGIPVDDSDEVLAICRPKYESQRAVEAQPDDLRLTEFAVYSAAESMFTISPQGEFLTVNQIACERLEYTHDELVAMHVYDINPEYPQERWNVYWESLRDEGRKFVETRHRTKSGKILNVEVSAAHFHYGDIEYCCAFVRDVTQRMRADCLSDLQRRAFEAIASGLTLDQILQELCELVDEKLELRGTVCKVSEVRSLITGKRKLALDLGSATGDNNDGVREQIRAYLNRDFEPLSYEENHTNILGNDEEILGALVPGEEVGTVDSELRRELLSVAANAASIAIEKYRRDEKLNMTEFTVDNTAADIFWVNAHAGFKFVNETACRQLGYAREEFLCMSVFDIAPDVTPTTWPEIWGRAKKNRMVKFESRHRRSNGEVYPVDVTLTFITFLDSEYIVAFTQDASLRKEAERHAGDLRAELSRLERAGSMGEMAANLAHKVNQPLAVIANYAGVCADGLSKNELPIRDVRFALEKINDQALVAGDIIRNLREFLHDAEAKGRYVNVNHVIHEVVALLNQDIVGNNVEIRVNLKSDLPTVQIDRLRIAQVIYNLLLNAIDAFVANRTDRIDGRITIGTDCIDSQVVVTVEDTGQGIPADQLEHVFEPFVTTKHGGLGMGLSICRTIIASHEGQIQALRNDSQGTTIQFSLPAGPPLA